MTPHKWHRVSGIAVSGRSGHAAALTKNTEKIYGRRPCKCRLLASACRRFVACHRPVRSRPGHLPEPPDPYHRSARAGWRARHAGARAGAEILNQARPDRHRRRTARALRAISAPRQFSRRAWWLHAAVHAAGSAHGEQGAVWPDVVRSRRIRASRHGLAPGHYARRQSRTCR